MMMPITGPARLPRRRRLTMPARCSNAPPSAPLPALPTRAILRRWRHSRRFGHTTVALPAEAGDPRVDLIAVGEEPAPVGPVAGRRPGQDEVAGLQRGDVRGVRDQPGHIEDHVLGRLVLHYLAVQAQG